MLRITPAAAPRIHSESPTGPERPAAGPAASGTSDRVPTTLCDLPSELVSDIGGYLFTASVHDPKNAVDSLAVTDGLRSALSEELHAGRVLRTIRSSRDFAGLISALREVEGVFARYRHGCLTAVLQMLPRLDYGRVLPQPFWDCLHRLLPTVVTPPGPEIAGGNAREDLLVRIAGAVCCLAPHSISHFKQVLALVGEDSVTGPRLDNALMRWAGAMLKSFRNTLFDQESIRQWLVPKAPPGVRPRLLALCDFAKAMKDFPSDPERHRQALANVPAADLPVCLRAAPLWWRAAGMSPAFRQLHQEVFGRLSPAQQVAMVRENLSPHRPDEVAPFLLGRIGQVPAIALLQALDSHVPYMAQTDLLAVAQLLRPVLRQAIGTPRLAETLRHAITCRTAREPRTAGLLAEALAHLPEDERFALDLRLGMHAIGAWQTPSPAGSLAALSRRVDDLLAAPARPSAPALEALVGAQAGWLRPQQRSRLIQRVMELPPGAASWLLADLVPPVQAVRPPAYTLALIDQLTAACRRLPPEHQAPPLERLLDLACSRTIDGWSCSPETLGAITRIHQALPGAQRPAFNQRWQALLAPATVTATDSGKVPART